MMKTRFTLAASALALLSLTGCATQSQVDDHGKQSQLATENGSLSSFNFTIHEGQKKWEFGTLLRNPVSVSTPSTRHGHCKVEAEPFEANGKGPISDVNLNVVDGTSMTILPLQQTPTGVLALIRIEASFSDVDPSVVSWEVGTTTHACSFSQGTVQTDLIQTSLFLEYGRPEKLKLKDSVYEITASKGQWGKALKR